MDGKTEAIVIGDEGKTWWSRNKNPRGSETIDRLLLLCNYEKRGSGVEYR
jgi:hypothetical protein